MRKRRSVRTLRAEALSWACASIFSAGVRRNRQGDRWCGGRFAMRGAARLCFDRKSRPVERAEKCEQRSHAGRLPPLAGSYSLSRGTTNAFAGAHRRADWRARDWRESIEQVPTQQGAYKNADVRDCPTVNYWMKSGHTCRIRLAWFYRWLHSKRRLRGVLGARRAARC